MPKQLDDSAKLQITQYLQKRPYHKTRLLNALRQSGMDVSEFEDPTNTISDNAAAFMAGIPEGASFGILDLEDIGKEAGAVDLPFLGEVQPAREAGRLLGGAVTGAALWKSGMRVGVPAGQKVIDSLIRKGVNPNSRALKGVGKITEIGVAAAPEAVVGGFIAPIARGEDANTLDESLAEWMALGIGSEVLARKVLSWRAKRKMQGNTPEVVSEGENIRKEVLQEVEQQNDLRLNNDGEPDGPSRPLSVDEQEILLGPETSGAWSSKVDQAELDEYNKSAPIPSERITPAYTDAGQASRARSNANRRAVNRHEKLIGDDHPWPDQNVTSPKINWTYRGPSGTEWKTENKDLFTLNLSESNATKGYGKEVFVNQKVKLNGPVAQLRTTTDNNGITRRIIEIDEEAMRKLWQQPERWTKGKGGIYGISPKMAHGDLRDSYDNFRTFVVLHELEHIRMPKSKWKEYIEKSHKGKELTEAADSSGALNPPKLGEKETYENYINKQAIRRYNSLEPEVKLIKDEQAAETNVFADAVNKRMGVLSRYHERTKGVQRFGISQSRGTSVEQFPVQPNLEPNSEWVGEYYHGTTKNNLVNMIDPETGTLHLKTSLNFGGKTNTVSFSTNYRESQEYSERVRNPLSGAANLNVPTMRDSDAPVIAIKKDVLDSIVNRETDTEWSVDSDIWISKEDYRIIENPRSQEYSSLFEGKSFDELSKDYIRDTSLSEAAESGFQSPTLNVDFNYSRLLEKEIVNRISDDPKLLNAWREIASGPDGRMAPYDMSDWFDNWRQQKERLDDIEQFPVQPQAGGEGLAPEAMLRELASLITEVRRLDPQASLNSLNYIVPGIKVTDAQNLIDHLKGVRTHARNYNHSQEINSLERLATSQSFDYNEPPLPEYATIEVDPDTKRKSTGLMHSLFRKFWVPTSNVLGFGADPISTHAIRNTVDLIGRKQGIEVEYTERLNEILNIVMQKPGAEGVMARVGRADSDDKAVRASQFFNLVEDLNNYTPYGTAIENYPLMKSNPRIQQAITMHQALTNDIADQLGLGKNRRMRYYVPHIFEDRAGEYAAASVSAQMSPDDAIRLKDLVDDINRPGSEEVGEEVGRGFRHLRGREINFDGFEHDYRKIMHMYIRGATSKITNDKIARHINSAQSRLISEGQGEVAKDLSKYGLYAMGMPTDFRTKVATKFADSHLFNSTVDRLMTFVGGKDASVLTRAREAGEDVTNEMSVAARQFMQEMHDMVRVRDRITGERTGNEKKKLKFIQAKLAKRLDDFRQNMNNPYSAAATSNFLYRTQIIAKLGFNIAHGMINQTQTLTNTLPMLKAKNVGWAYAHSAFNVGMDKKLNGRAISEIIEESGISKDVNRYEEFLDGFSGVWSKVQNASMILARYSEKVNRETALLGGYKEYVEAGMSHHAALHKARELVSKTQFPFNKAGTAPILRDPTGRLFLMFKSYPMHQTDFTIDLVAKAIESKDFSSLAKHAMSYLMLIGGGAYLLPNTNIGERSTPPFYDIPSDIIGDTGRYSFPGAVAKNISGPFGDTLTDVFGMITALIDGGTDHAVDKAVQAANSFAIPATVRRFYGDEIDIDDLLKGKKYDWLYFTGLKKYEPGSRNNKIPGAIRPLNPLQGLGLQ